MRLFLDTASVEECRKAAKLGVVSGVTTNPSLWARAGGGNYREIILEIAGIIDGPISAECLSRDAEGLVDEARRIAGWHANVVSRYPSTRRGWRPSLACRRRGSRLTPR
jgi:transaldolase